MSHEEDRACQTLQTEQPIYAETAITAIESTWRGFDQCLTVQIRRQRALRPQSKALFKDVVWNAKQRSGLQGDRGACGGPGAPRLRHCWLGTISIFTAAEMAGRMTFVTCRARLVILEKTQNLNRKTLCFISLTAPYCRNVVFFGDVSQWMKKKKLWFFYSLLRKCELNYAVVFFRIGTGGGKYTSQEEVPHQH